MAVTEVNKEEVKPSEPTAQELQAREANDMARRAFEEMNQLKGQLSVLAAAATAGTVAPPAEEATPDIITETEKALDVHVRKRTQPLIDAQMQREAAREREMIALKRPEDWKSFGKDVERLIQDNRINPETLAQPGAYEKLLLMVKAEKIDEIVNQQVKEKMAAAALASVPSKTEPTSTPASRKYEMTDREKVAARKMGISEAEWIASASATTVDDSGWIVGVTE